MKELFEKSLTVCVLLLSQCISGNWGSTNQLYWDLFQCFIETVTSFLWEDTG